MTEATKSKLERIAIEVCDRYFGTIPRRDQQNQQIFAFDALVVSRVYLSSDGTKTEVTERHKRIYEHLCLKFKEEVEEHVPIIFTGPAEDDECGYDEVAMDYATSTFWDELRPIFRLAWREVERRENHGQDVVGKLNELTWDLIKDLTVDCLWSLDLSRRGRLARMYRLAKGGLKS